MSSPDTPRPEAGINGGGMCPQCYMIHLRGFHCIFCKDVKLVPVPSERQPERKHEDFPPGKDRSDPAYHVVRDLSLPPPPRSGGDEAPPDPNWAVRQRQLHVVTQTICDYLSDPTARVRVVFERTYGTNKWHLCEECELTPDHMHWGPLIKPSPPK